MSQRAAEGSGTRAREERDSGEVVRGVAVGGGREGWEVGEGEGGGWKVGEGEGERVGRWVRGREWEGVGRWVRGRERGLGGG